ncbi:hypothetical protein TUMSATVNIG1_60060 (plasmid) [Vibrio nigripulchritudo]|uniref:site-specific integrase n=1 Tax=Vibrio nigripulchritudo TaxID=28173 RepID=UPI001909AA9A|nr:site-specific integrase [Vibrio nigripulchritudo]BCL74020.1 hypothetical protein VNTUMSATTG_59570 [Vibrio nigripulchritudo]BDU35397.1 hypothetical protein TUMSATVNIG1_60060 [Vibrio nigripulchritudo]
MREFNTCSILNHYFEHGSLDGAPFHEPISQYNIERLQYILKKSNPTGDCFSNWEQIVGFCVSEIQPKVKPDTWKRYKAVLLNPLNEGRKNQSASTMFIDRLCSDLSATLESSLGPDKATSSKKNKQVSREELYILKTAAQTKEERFCVSWLETSILCGARPNEVCGAELSYLENGPVLSVKNTIKSERTRQNIESGKQPEYRLISLSAISYHNLIDLESFLMELNAKLKDESYQSIYDRARSKLSNLAKKLLGKPISLSAGRSQFSSNHKAMVGDPHELMELMGHTDVTRSKRSYGKAVHAHTKPKEEES